MSSEWRKSTYSSTEGGNCVEVAADGLVLVRDTTDREGCTLSVSAGTWAKFTGTVK
ncbi:MAG TPA: DUF397 domain-containing protein [Trebonia sp.]|jgi:hypothetical protein|nr:DUF397 domain-containing protein [Trebonia sp.]